MTLLSLFPRYLTQSAVCYNVTIEYVNLSRKVLATDMILPNILLLSFAYVTVCQKFLFKGTKIGEGKSCQWRVLFATN
jgi:hypothetical protein